MSLRLRLTLMMSGLFSVGLVVLYLAAGSYALMAADRSYDRLLAGSALSIIEAMGVKEDEILVDIPYAALDMLSEAPEDRVFYSVVGPDLGTHTGYTDLPRPKEGWGEASSPGMPLALFFDADYLGEPVRFVLLGREIARPGSTGTVWVQVGQTRHAREVLQHELVLRALAPIFLITFLALALVWFGSRSALRPLQAIGDELANRDPSDFRPISDPVPPEIAPMIGSLNDFMRRLQANTDRQRAFIADAAHQMRTPLAALLAQAQLAPGSDTGELREAVARIEHNAARLKRLLNQLLSDATVHHRSDIPNFGHFDLLNVIKHAIRETILETDENDLRFTTNLRAAPLFGDQVMLGEAIKNLIDNALHHSGQNLCELSLERSADGSEYLLAVEDRGIGIPDEYLEQVFERFARGVSNKPGAGLGLSIARRAVESHGGTIAVANRSGGGLRVEIQLPAEPV